MFFNCYIIYTICCNTQNKNYLRKNKFAMYVISLYFMNLSESQASWIKHILYGVLWRMNTKNGSLIFLGWAIATLSCHEFSRMRDACYIILYAISSAILHIYYTLICHSLCIISWESLSFLSPIYYNNPFLNWIIEVDGSVFC